MLDKYWKSVPGAGRGQDFWAEDRIFELRSVGPWEGGRRRGCQTGGGAKACEMMTAWASLHFCDYHLYYNSPSAFWEEKDGKTSPLWSSLEENVWETWGLQRESEITAKDVNVAVHQKLKATWLAASILRSYTCIWRPVNRATLWGGVCRQKAHCHITPAYTPTLCTALCPALLPVSLHKGRKSHKVLLQHMEAQQHLKIVSSKNVSDKIGAKINSPILWQRRVLPTPSTAQRCTNTFPPNTACRLSICTSRPLPQVSKCWTIIQLGFLPLRGNSVFFKKEKLHC